MKNVKCKVAELGDSRKELDPKSGKGYGYFKTIGNICGDFAADFDYGGGVVMRAFIANGSEGRESFALEGPKVFRHYDRKVSEKPCPTLLVRQNGEAWRRPFVAVYEPFGKGVDATIESVEILSKAPFWTVKTHAKSILQKLEVQNTAGAITRAFELGLLRA